MKLLFPNKKIRLNYHILESYECGISLFGTEVKSLVKANASIDESFVIFKGQEAFLINMYVAPFEQGNIHNKDPYRTRKLLLHKNEIIKIEHRVKKERLAIVPNKIYLNNGKIKVEIAVCQHKNPRDKRQDIKIRDIKREARRY
ncbi:MAG: SsrA-binding protein SmpB [Mycoplasmataceae bacterium]|jgi:SsrA-binding protein|nr:SsrA-binding protein SmpB [Mycoplasmataceae bacterium]